MKTILSTAAALAMASALAAPASAQVAGIGVADPAVVIAASKALNGAFGQIATTYSAQNTQLQQLNQQSQAVIKTFDTNNDGKLDAAELQAAQSDTGPKHKQLQDLQDQINKVRQPMDMAAAYAVEQIAQQLNQAVQQVVTQNSVQMILPSSGVLYHNAAADLNTKLITVLDQKVPQVSITPPAGWQPDQGTVQLLNDVQQARAEIAQAQQARAQQTGGAQTPAARPAPATGKPVKGR